MAAAIIALALEANPRLTWRDVQHLVVRTSRPAHLVAADWTTNGAGRRVSHLYGFGLMNAEAMVVAAESWRRVPEQRTCRGHADRTLTWIRPEKKLVAIAKVSGCRDDPAGRVAHLEHVVVRVTLTHVRRGDLAIFLTSPAGTRSQLLANRMYDHSQEGFKDWEFMTSHCWGEAPGGAWVLEILDTPSQPRNPKAMGKLKEWSLILYGTEEPPQGDAPPAVARSPLKREYARSLSGKRSLWDSWWLGSDEDDVQQPAEYMGPCNPECPYCDGPNEGDCFFCVHYNLRNGTERVCVPSCPHGFYGNNALKRCLRCGKFCVACEPSLHSTGPPAGSSTGSTNVTKAPPSGPPACTRCINSTFLLPGSRDCVTSCGFGFYKDTATSSCLSCGPNCTRCSGGPNSCSECSEGYSVQAGSCHVTCPDGTFPGADQQCLQCHKTCSVCGGPREQDCSRCAPTYVLRDGWQCVRECGTGLYPAPCPDSPEQRCCSSGCGYLSCCGCGRVCRGCVGCDGNFSGCGDGNCGCGDADCGVVCGNCDNCGGGCGNCGGAVCSGGAGNSGVVCDNCGGGCVEYWDQQQRRCHLCDAACRTCSGSGRDSCTSCEGTSLWKGQCVYLCPPDTFLWGARCIACADHTTPPDCLNCRTDACAAYDAAARHRSVVKAAVIVSLALGVAAIAGVLIFGRSRRGGGGPCPPCPSLSRDCCPVGYRRLRTAVGGGDANSRVGEAPLKFRANGEGVTLVGAEEGAEEGDGGDSGDEAGTGFKVMYVSGDGKVYRKFYYGSDDEGAVEDLGQRRRRLCLPVHPGPRRWRHVARCGASPQPLAGVLARLVDDHDGGRVHDEPSAEAPSAPPPPAMVTLLQSVHRACLECVWAPPLWEPVGGGGAAGSEGETRAEVTRHPL
ncbi:unnamed protein product [Lampetra fluviatilis]